MQEMTLATASLLSCQIDIDQALVDQSLKFKT